MPKPIVKLSRGDQSWYMVWSTIVDAPATFGMTRQELTEYVREQQGADGLRDLDQSLERVEKYGSSYFEPQSAEEVLSFNRAGYQETELTLDQIIDIYCVEQREPRKGEGHLRPIQDLEQG